MNKNNEKVVKKTDTQDIKKVDIKKSGTLKKKKKVIFFFHLFQ